MNNPFIFFTRFNLTELLGIKAKNIIELLEGIKSVPGSSIYFHTHRYIQQHHFLSPEPPNDFAYWVTNILQEDKLGERLASIDIIQFKKISDIREIFITIIEQYINRNPSSRQAYEGEQFHFMKSISFIMKTQYSAKDLKEFLEIVTKVSTHSIYFHMFEARLRLEKVENDFSYWMTTELREGDLADKISKLDPYTQTLESLRNEIIFLIEKRING